MRFPGAILVLTLIISLTFECDDVLSVHMLQECTLKLPFKIAHVNWP